MWWKSTNWGHVSQIGGQEAACSEHSNDFFFLFAFREIKEYTVMAYMLGLLYDMIYDMIYI